jgi:hypothetical protein
LLNGWRVQIFGRGLIPIGRANITRAAIVFTGVEEPGGLTDGRRAYRPPRHGRIWHMTKNKDIREAVEAELGFDPLVDTTDITVRNMNGDVALNGTVPSYPQYLEAAAAAQRIDGVKNVHNHLEVVLPPGDYRDDVMLTTAANNALTLNVTVRPPCPAGCRHGSPVRDPVPFPCQQSWHARPLAELFRVRRGEFLSRAR